MQTKLTKEKSRTAAPVGIIINICIQYLVVADPYE